MELAQLQTIVTQRRVVNAGVQDDLIFPAKNGHAVKQL
jgi:hypothetical protein